MRHDCVRGDGDAPGKSSDCADCLRADLVAARNLLARVHRDGGHYTGRGRWSVNDFDRGAWRWVMGTTIERMRAAEACADCASPDDWRGYRRRAADNLDCDGCARILALAAVPEPSGRQRNVTEVARNAVLVNLRADIEDGL